MSEFQIVSIISLLGFLILVVGELRTHRLGVKRSLVMIGLWVAIFSVVALFIGAVS